MNHKPCIACGGKTAQPLYPELRVVQCGDCAFVYADMEIDPCRIYTEEYFRGAVYPDYERERRSLQKNFEQRLEVIRRLLPAESRVFEIGSAFGYFLELAKKEYEASGIEISAAAAKFSRERTGVNVVAGDFLSLPDPAKPDYSLVCMWDVIEHLERPDLFLEKARRWLAPGGLVAVTTGDISSWLARKQGPRWRQISPPAHLHFFSQQTLTRLFGRLGFEVIHASHPGMYRGYASTVELLLDKPWLRRLFTLGNRLDFQFYINTFDLVFLIARKTSS